MIEASEVAEFYEVKPTVVDGQVVHANAFIAMMETTQDTLGRAFDSLAYLAGIKSAAAQDPYKTLDTSSLQSLLRSAQAAGLSARVVAI